MMEFNSFGSFASHLALVAVRVTKSEHKVLERAGKLVLRQAQAKIGVYQPASGPFAAWAPLAESTQASRTALGFTANDPLLRMGELRESYGYEVDGHEVSVGSSLSKALWLEAGTIDMPPRSVVGAALSETAEQVVEILGGGVVGAIIGDHVVELARG